MSDDILKSKYFVVSFDESLKATVQECEMDLLVRYWDSIKNRFQVGIGIQCSLVIGLMQIY